MFRSKKPQKTVKLPKNSQDDSDESDGDFEELNYDQGEIVSSVNDNLTVMCYLAISRK